MEIRDLAWLVGLFEGEGCIGLGHQGRPNLSIGMSDEDTVRRAQRIAGVGHVRARPTPTKSGKTMWVFLVGRCEHAAALLMTMYPMLGERRKARAREVLVSWKVAPLPKRLRTHCPRGHPYAGDNLIVDTTRGNPRRSCRACRRIHRLTYYYRMKGARS